VQKKNLSQMKTDFCNGWGSGGEKGRLPIMCLGKREKTGDMLKFAFERQVTPPCDTKGGAKSNAFSKNSQKWLKQKGLKGNVSV